MHSTDLLSISYMVVQHGECCAAKQYNGTQLAIS